MLVFACGGKDATAFDPAGKEWELSLSNTNALIDVKKIKDRKELDRKQLYGLFKPGDIIWLEGDTIFAKNEYQVRFTNFARRYLLLTEPEVPDTLVGFRLTEGEGNTMTATMYKGDSLLCSWLFEEKQDRYSDIEFGELNGQSYRSVMPEGDTVDLYFGTSVHTYGRNEGKAYEYFVEEEPGFREERSYVEAGDRYWTQMIEMRNQRSIYFSAGKNLAAKQPVFKRDKQGEVIAVYFTNKDDAYERVELPLTLLPANESINEADFADRVNGGVVTVDTDYPRVDSQYVSFRYQDDYKGLEFDELSELEFSAEPGGEFIVVVRDRLLWNHKWKLSADGRYLITMGKKGRESGHYPILAYTDEHIDLRIPFTVKTREPRGVALESFAEINAFVRIKRRGAATSR